MALRSVSGDAQFVRVVTELAHGEVGEGCAVVQGCRPTAVPDPELIVRGERAPGGASRAAVVLADRSGRVPGCRSAGAGESTVAVAGFREVITPAWATACTSMTSLRCPPSGALDTPIA